LTFICPSYKFNDEELREQLNVKEKSGFAVLN